MANTPIIGIKPEFETPSPGVAGHKPDISGSYYITATHSVQGVKISSRNADLTSKWGNYETVPDLKVRVHPSSMRMESQSYFNSAADGSGTDEVTLLGNKFTSMYSGETLTAFTCWRAKMKLSSWKSLRSITIEGNPNYIAIAEIYFSPDGTTWTLWTTRYVGKWTGNWPSYYHQFLNAFQISTYPWLMIDLRFYQGGDAFVNEMWPAKAGASGEYYGMIHDQPITVFFDFMQKHEILTPLFVGSIAAVAKWGLETDTVQYIDGAVRTLLQGLNLAEPILIAICAAYYRAYRNKWIPTLDDFKRSLLGLLPRLSEKIGLLAAGAGAQIVPELLANKYESEYYTATQGLKIAGSGAAAAAYSLVINDILDDIGFDMFPAGEYVS